MEASGMKKRRKSFRDVTVTQHLYRFSKTLACMLFDPAVTT